MKSVRSAAFVLSLLLTGCACSFSVGDSQPLHALREYRPTKEARIDAVSLSHGGADGEGFDKSRVATKLPTGTTRILVWYAYDSGKSGDRVEVRWFYEDEAEPFGVQVDTLDSTWGESGWPVTARGTPFPAGTYRVELSENGTVVTTIPFTIDS